MSAVNHLPCTKRTRFSPDQVQALEDLLDYVFNDKCLLDKAFETPGSGSDPDGHRGLAQLGDAVLRFEIIWLYGSKRGYSRNETSTFHDSRATNEALAICGFSKGLEKYVLVNRCQWGQRPSKGTMATTVEALIAVVFIDSQGDHVKVRKTIIALGILEAE